MENNIQLYLSIYKNKTPIANLFPKLRDLRGADNMF